MNCKYCGTELLPPKIEKAQKDFEDGNLKGFCGNHDWQVLTLAEQEIMMGAIQGKLALSK
jgi:hypothetical protein